MWIWGCSSTYAGFEAPSNLPDLLFLIDTKASHKLTAHIIDQAVAGDKTLEPRTMMGRGGGDSDDTEDCEYRFAAVCTQIYTSMIDKGLRYGIIFTGVRYVFVSIDTSNLSVLRYSICHASRSQDIGTTPLMCVVSLALLALQDGLLPPGRQSDHLQDGGGLIWSTATASFTTANSPDPQTRAETMALDTLNRRDHLTMSSPPGTPPRSHPGQAAVEAHRKIPLYPSLPLQGESHGKRRRKDDDLDLDKVSIRPAKQVKADKDVGLTASPASPASPTPLTRSLASKHIGLGNRQFCTQTCLQSVVLGPRQQRPSADTMCPNYDDHKVVLNAEEFCGRLRAQLITRLDPALPPFYSGHEFLDFLSGHTQIIKLRLHDSGHVLLAKAFMPSDLRTMHREARFYTHLRHLQGRYIPVCLGTIELPLAQAFSHSGFRFTGLLLLAWAGIGPEQWSYLGGGLVHGGESDQAFTQALQVEVGKALAEIHKAGVLHRDVAPCPEWRLQVTIIDFELSRNRAMYKHCEAQRNGGSSRKDLNEEFAKALVKKMDECAGAIGKWCPKSKHVATSK